MRGWPALAGLILFLPALLFGIRRSTETLSSVAALADHSSHGVEAPAGNLPAANLIVRAARSDSTAALSTVVPRHSPFRRALPKKTGRRLSPPPPEGDAIPRVEAVLADHGKLSAVLRIGDRRSGPIGRGDSFDGWKVIGLDWESVLVGREGVIYTLSVPAAPPR